MDDDGADHAADLSFATTNGGNGARSRNYCAYPLRSWIRLHYWKNPLTGRTSDDLEFTPRSNVGWKLHISVSSAAIASAWDLLYPIVVRHRLQMKAAGTRLLERFSDPQQPQAGKMLTLYFGAADDGQEVLRSIVSEIEAALRGAGIAPGIPVARDIPFPGSAYISRRNDDDGFGRYQDSFAPPVHIEQDPFAGISVRAAL